MDIPTSYGPTRLLARHVREHAVAAGHPCLASVVQGTVCKILARDDVKPHKVRYYLERRDAAFETKMAEVFCVYREVAVLRATDAGSSNVAIISYDEKPGIQAIGNTAPDLPPKPGVHAAIGRDHEYQRHGTLSLLAGIDLLTGKVHACVEDRHRSREFVSFLKRLDAAYSADTAIKLILDNHAAHISKQTKAWVATKPEGRFAFVFTPKHASWLNLVEGFFSKWRARCSATFASHRRPNSRHASSLISMTSTPIPSSTPGPTRSARSRDRSRFMETLY